MKQKIFALYASLNFLLLANWVQGQCLDDAPASRVASPSNQAEFPLRAFSLKILQQKLEACHGRPCSEELLQMGGLTQLFGYIVDSGNKDLIFYGLADAKRPAIHAEDFAIALRNTRLRYAAVRGNVREYSYPGCDIRPDGEVAQQFMALGQRFFANPSSNQTILNQLKRVCESPQHVTVLGVPFDTHFGQVMVTADYNMKSITDGSIGLNLPGLISLIDMHLSKIRHSLRQGQQPMLSIPGMHRFWLFPGENIFEEDDGVILIKQSPVQILTHLIGAGAGGQIQDISGRDPMAEEFVRNFSTLYDKVAEVQPIYRELENLFHLLALAKTIEVKNADQFTGLNLKYFLDLFPIANTSVRRQVPGKFAVKEFQQSQQIGNAIQTLQLWLPSCGGVEMRIEATRDKFRPDATGLLSDLKRHLLNARPTPQTLAWPAPILSGSRLSGLPHGLRLRRINRNNSTIHVFTVIDAGSEYRVYNGGPGEFYRGLDVSELMKNMNTFFATQRDVSTVYLKLEGFAESKMRNFKSSIDRQTSRLQRDLVFRMLPGSGEIVDEILFSPGIRVERIPQSTKRVTQGRWQGWYHAVVDFTIRVGNQLRTISVIILARSADLVDAFLQRLRIRFSVYDALPLSIVDLLNQVRSEVKQLRNISDDDLQIIIQEPENCHTVENWVPKLVSIGLC